MKVFQNCGKVDEIIISAEKKYFDYIHSIAVKNKITKLTKLTEGGKTRFHSVKNAFKSIGGSGNDLVLIHDAARPGINIKIVEKLIDENREVITGVRITETVKKSGRQYVTKTINRENLWIIQTPQLFRHKVLENSYKKCGRENDFTDEAAMVEFAGYKVAVIEGLRDNIKITTQSDFITLKKLMKK
jgi:2-C-methyl-D-erythritol 4-phosphate cytidylyltransferase